MGDWEGGWEIVMSWLEFFLIKSFWKRGGWGGLRNEGGEVAVEIEVEHLHWLVWWVEQERGGVGTEKGVETSIWN